MSLKAMLWVMEHAPADNHAELAILYALAERADDQGCCCWPSQEWVAERARCSTRTVRRHLNAMEGRGLIRRGDQRFVAHIRKDRRPIVWDLNLDARREPPVDDEPPAIGQSDRPTTGQSGPPPPERPDTDGTTAGHPGTHGRTPRDARPDTAVSYKPSLTIHEPSKNQPPVVPQGGPDELSSEIATINDTTPAPTDSGAPGRKRGSRLPEGFMPSAETIAAVRATFPGMESEFMGYEHEKFCDYWSSVSGLKGTKLDWDATWRNWMKRAVENLRPAERQGMFGRAQAPQPAAPSKQQQARDLAAQLSAEGAFAGRRLRS